MASAIGRTTLEHAHGLLSRAGEQLLDVQRRIAIGRERKPAAREQLSRDLAGVIAWCESLRMWLNAGAPR